MQLSRQKKKEPAFYVSDPLAAIPQQPELVERKEDSGGCIHLRLQVPTKGLTKRVADLFGFDYSKKLQLDEYGTLYYRQVDGRTPLHTIVARMVSELGRSRKEVEEGVILFTKKLMVMRMLTLHIPESARVRRSHEQS